MRDYKLRDLSTDEKWVHFIVAWVAIPAAIFTAWMFSIVTGWFDVSYPAYINWLVGYISYEADLVKLSQWKTTRENTR